MHQALGTYIERDRSHGPETGPGPAAVPKYLQAHRPGNPYRQGVIRILAWEFFGVQDF